MSFWRLMLASLGFHWRSHLAVALATAVGTAVLLGALGVGHREQEDLRAWLASLEGDTIERTD